MSSEYVIFFFAFTQWLSRSS